MNRFVKTALAIAVAGSAANAGTGDNEWTALDSEISGLASSLTPSQDGSGWSLLLRAVYSHSSDDIATGGAGDNPDLSGFNFNDVDAAFWANFGPYLLRVSADVDDNEGGSGVSFELEDAYIQWDCGGYFDARIGNFKPHVSRSNSVDPEHLLFIDRSAIGSSFDNWDNGIGVSGNWEEQLYWYAALMNGNGFDDDGISDGQGHTSDHFYLLRGEWNIGSGAGMHEGAMGSSDTLNGTVGISFFNDDTVQTSGGDSDTSAFLLDFHGNVSQVGFGGEIADIDDDYVGLQTDEDFSNIFSPAGSLDIANDSKPWNVYVSYLITPEWEVGVRYEDLDNDEVGSGATADADGEDNTLLSVVANWYRAGSAGKWQAQWTDIETDDSNATNDSEGSIFEIGFSVGATR
jgi:hypothetical protein